MLLDTRSIRDVSREGSKYGIRHKQQHISDIFDVSRNNDYQILELKKPLITYLFWIRVSILQQHVEAV